MYKTFGEALSDVWQSAIKKVKEANKSAKELKTYREFPKATSMAQPNLSNEYKREIGYNYGD